MLGLAVAGWAGKDGGSGLWVGLKEGVLLHFNASLCSGFISTVMSLPLDTAKTRIQQLSANSKTYKGLFDCVTQTARKEGILALWKGFIPAYIRMAPQTTITFIVLEQLKILYFTFTS